MKAHEEAARLVGLRQAALGSERTPTWRAGAQRAYGEAVGAFAEHLRAGHHLEGVLNLLLSEIALERNRAGLPAPDLLAESRATAGTPVDVHLEQTGPATAADVALLDRLGAELAARFPYWAVTAANRSGGVVSARPDGISYPAGWLGHAAPLEQEPPL